MGATEQIHLRATPEQVEMIRQGAETAKMSLSRFMLEASTALAKNVLNKNPGVQQEQLVGTSEPEQEVQEKVQPEPAVKPDLIYVEDHEYEGCDCDWNEGGGIKDWAGKMHPYTGPDCAIKRIQRQLASR